MENQVTRTAKFLIENITDPSTKSDVLRPVVDAALERLEPQCSNDERQRALDLVFGAPTLQ